MASWFKPTTGGGSAAFTVARDDGNKTLVQQPAQMSVRPIPGGNVVYADYGGLGPATLSLGIYTTTLNAFNSLLSMIGQAGTVNYEGSAMAAVLLNVADRQAILTSQTYFGRAEFLVSPTV